MNFSVSTMKGEGGSQGDEFFFDLHLLGFLTSVLSLCPWKVDACMDQGQVSAARRVLCSDFPLPKITPKLH